MQTTITLHPVTSDAGTSTGYAVTSDCGHNVIQDYAPGASGNVPMTQDEALAYAQGVSDLLLASVQEPTP